MLDLETQVEPRPATPVNRDFAPIAYYFDVVLWSARFQSRWRNLMESMAGLRFAVIAGALGLVALTLTLVIGLCDHLGAAPPRGSASSQDGSPQSPLHRRATLGLCVASMGFTLLGLEVLLLLGFQALYGYVYQQLAVLVALFMVGMAVERGWS